MLTKKLLSLAVAGGSEWVMVLLLVLSVISIATILERALFFRRRRRYWDELDRLIKPLALTESWIKLREVVQRAGEASLEAAISDAPGLDRESRANLVDGVMPRVRYQLERRLAFLGTLGNNAPFIGLFGTVLGIIRAFRDLSLDTMEGSGAVMAGISEALVATAVGLFVAIPAVIAYNYFQRQADRILSITESLTQTLLARAPAGAGRAHAAPAESEGI